MKLLHVKTVGEAWLNAMQSVLMEGMEIADEHNRLLEVCNLYITIDEVEEQDALLVRYADKRRIALMKEKYATCGLVGDYKIDYGSYIYNNNGVDQVEWLKNRIKQKIETKSATIGLHKPGEEFLACLSLIDFKYRNNKLNMTIVYRSQNVFSSHPGNLVALRGIQNDVANSLNMQVGKIELLVISAHIYEFDFDEARRIVFDWEQSTP